MVSARGGDTGVFSMANLTKTHTLDTGESGARSACTSSNFHFVAAYNKDVYIYDKKRDYAKMSSHNFGEWLTAMNFVKSEDGKKQFILCGTYSGKMFLAKVYTDAN